MMSVLSCVRVIRIRWRRWRLLRAYSRVFRIRTGKGAGFTPLMAAWQAAERDGHLTVEDGEVNWHWPETASQDGGC